MGVNWFTEKSERDWLMSSIGTFWLADALGERRAIAERHSTEVECLKNLSYNQSVLLNTLFMHSCFQPRKNSPQFPLTELFNRDFRPLPTMERLKAVIETLIPSPMSSLYTLRIVSFDFDVNVIIQDDVLLRHSIIVTPALWDFPLGFPSPIKRSADFTLRGHFESTNFDHMNGRGEQTAVEY